MQSQRALRHDLMQKLGQLVVVIVRHDEIGTGGAEQIVRRRLTGWRSINIDAVFIIEQGQDKRNNWSFSQPNAANDIGATIAEKPTPDDIDTNNMRFLVRR